MRATRSLWSDRKSQEKVIDRGKQEVRREEKKKKKRERERVGRGREKEMKKDSQGEKERSRVRPGEQVPYCTVICLGLPLGLCAWWRVALAVAEIKLGRVWPIIGDRWPGTPISEDCVGCLMWVSSTVNFDVSHVSVLSIDFCGD